MTQPLPPPDGYDPISNIREKPSQQQNIQPSDHADDAVQHDEISRLSTSLLSLCKEVILSLREQATIPKDVRISLERSCSAMILWSDGYGIAQGNLNDIFKRSSKLRYTLFTNLSHLGRVLTERLIPLADISSEKLQGLCSSVESSIEDGSGIVNEQLYQESDDSSSDAGSTFSDDNIYEVAEDLKTDTYVLSSLDPLIKYPIFDLEKGKAIEDDVHSTWSPEKLFIDRIERKFPLAEVSLASRLGKANFERYLRCQADRDALENEGSKEDLPSTQLEATGTIIAKSTFHDSGVGTSIAPTTTYADTLANDSHEGQLVRILLLPEGIKKRLPFSCVACGRTVRFTNYSTWKRHIYLDLQPYMCVDVSCSYSNTPFKNREKWISHLALEHEMEPKWDSIKCPLCEEETGSGELAVTRHFSQHLEEISLSALPREIKSEANSDNGSELSDSDPIITTEYTELNTETFTDGDDGGNSPQNSVSKPSKSYLPCEATPEYCSKKFPTKKELMKHYRAEHRHWADTHGNPNLSCSCEACGTTFTRPDYKKRHLNRFPKCRETIKQIENNRLENLSPSTGGTHTSPPSHSTSYPPKLEASFMREFTCCGKILPNLHDLLQHYEKAHTQASPPLPPGWTHEFDHSTKRWLYSNLETGITQENPPELKQPAAELAPLQSQSLLSLPQAGPPTSLNVLAHDSVDLIRDYSIPLNPSGEGTSSAFSSSAHTDEDWTKISDLAERRRVQNRIAQRNYRKKLKQPAAELDPLQSQSLLSLPQAGPPTSLNVLTHNSVDLIRDYSIPLNPSSEGTSSAFSSSAHTDEDWTKISDLAERRRVQNRIAQRNYRKKLKRRLEDLERRAGSEEGKAEKQSPPVNQPAASPNNLNPTYQRRYYADQETERTHLEILGSSQATAKDVVGQTAPKAKEQVASGVEE